MRHIEIIVLRLGGIARTSELYEATGWRSIFEIYRHRLIHVCQGWRATRYTPPAAIAARRYGGRLACVSALAHYGIGQGDGRLHVQVERGGRGPSVPWVVAHWSKRRLAGDRQSVSVPVARAQAARCLRASRAS